jgi:hypothetical protein
MTKTNTKKPISVEEIFTYTVGKSKKEYSKGIKYEDYIESATTSRRRVEQLNAWRYSIDNLLDMKDWLKEFCANTKDKIDAFKIYLTMVLTIKRINRQILKATHYHQTSINYKYVGSDFPMYYETDDMILEQTKFIVNCLKKRRYNVEYNFYTPEHERDYAFSKITISWDENKE